MASLKGVLSAFSPRGDQFVITTGDGRVKTWDVASGSLASEFNEIAVGQAALTPKGHLGLDYKCLAWGAISSGTKKSKKKSSLIALGTAGGDVLAWNPILGELKWRTNDCNAGGVNSICFVKGQSSLFSAGADGMVCELEVETGRILSKFRASKSAVTSISASPDGSKLLAAASELKLFEMETKKRKRKFTGHASSVTATSFTGDGLYALSGAEEDTHVALWEFEGSGKGAKLVFNLEHPAMAIDSWGFGKDGKTLRVLAVSQAGEAYIWSSSNLEELGKTSPVRISVGSKKGKPSKQSIISGKLAGSDSILIARGVTVKPSFESVSLPGEPGNIVLPPEKVNLLASEPEKLPDSATRNEVTVLGADNAADAKLTKNIELKKRKRKSDAGEEEPEKEPEKEPEMEPENEAMETEQDEARVEEDEEQTMEERLLALGLLDERPSSEGNAPENSEVIPPKSDSLDLLLAQALRSEDNILLEQCFTVVDEKVIANTIKKLSPADACTLLRLAISKLEARPRRGLQLLPWIQAALQENASFIILNSQVQQVLSALHQIIDARLHTFRPLLALSGRLNLIMAKINASGKSVEGEEETQAPAVYEEDDESEEEVEDAMQDYDEEEEDEGEDEEEGRAKVGAELGDDAMQEDKKPLENGGSFSDDDDSE